MSYDDEDPKLPCLWYHKTDKPQYSELSGVRDPQIVVTTSRDPSTRLGALYETVYPEPWEWSLTPVPTVQKRSGYCFRQLLGVWLPYQLSTGTLCANIMSVNRGNLVLPDLVNAAKTNEQTDVILLHEHRGQPSAITISHFPHGCV